MASPKLRGIAENVKPGFSLSGTPFRKFRKFLKNQQQKHTHKNPQNLTASEILTQSQKHSKGRNHRPTISSLSECYHDLHTPRTMM